MPVSIILSNQNIKLVSAGKNTVERWETISLPAGLVKDGHILDPKALAEMIDALFTSLDLPRNEVIASLTGLSFTYRVLMLPGIKPALQREAIERATRKEIRVPLDELYLDWQVFADAGKEMGVFVSGIPRPLIDALVKTMELARVNLIQVDIKSLALARAVNQANALIVSFEPDWFDIAIISKGIPVTLHTIAPKSNFASLEDNILQLKDELNRTIDFFNLTHKENPVLAGTPVILSGSLANDPATADLVAERLGRPTQNMLSPLKTPGNFPLRLYADNLGLILKNGNGGNSHKHSPEGYLDINVDPLNGRKRSLAHPRSRRKIGAYASVFVAIILIIGASLLRTQAAGETLKLQAESDRLNRSLVRSRLALDEAAVLETTINNLTTETLSLQKEREMISGRGKSSSFLEFIAATLPAGANYSDISSTPAEITLDGRANLRLDIIDFANNLTTSGKFNEVRIALIEKEPDNPADSTGSGYIFRIVIRR